MHYLMGCVMMNVMLNLCTLQHDVHVTLHGTDLKGQSAGWFPIYLPSRDSVSIRRGDL